MSNNWNKIVFYNSILSKAKDEEKKEAIQLYFQQLWQMDNLVVLLGAGFSKHLNGPLMGDLSKSILPGVILEGYKVLKKENTTKEELKKWVTLWGISENIIDSTDKKDTDKLKEHCYALNIEEKIGSLQSIVNAYEVLGGNADAYKKALDTIKEKIVSKISRVTPHISDKEFNPFCEKLIPYRIFLKRLIKYRRPQQPRIKIFSSNYDKIIESACDMEGINCITGFDGKNIRTMNATNFDLELSFRPTGQSSVYYPNLIHLYKLHGSIDWKKVRIEGMDEVIQDDNPGQEVIIYPCYTKFAETLEMPYYEMFRRLGSAVSQPQTVLLSLGYGFQDDHINQMILKAYKNPSCQLILCEPKAFDSSKKIGNFFDSLMEIASRSNSGDDRDDPRVTILGGDSANFPNILQILFPPIEIESPADRIKNLVKRLIEFGGK
ncbi:MAG: SIR2 family protein [Candidatus Omnitrophica bacterium]|nr:SIR2 family protein [Candidatus Omnitrophota bacterium]